MCENDFQTVIYKDGWLAQVGRMVWEQLQMPCPIEYDTPDPSSAVRDVQATRDAILSATEKAIHDLVEMNERYR